MTGSRSASPRRFFLLPLRRPHPVNSPPVSLLPLRYGDKGGSLLSTRADAESCPMWPRYNDFRNLRALLAPDVWFWPLADIRFALIHVCFRGNSGHRQGSAFALLLG